MPVDVVVRAVLAVSLANALCFAGFLLLRRRRRLSVAVAPVLCVLILATPWIVPAEHRLTRFVCAVLAAASFAKLVDVHHHATRLPPPSQFALYLLNASSMVLRRLPDEPSPTRRALLTTLFRGAATAALGLGAMWAVFRLRLGDVSFWVEHTAKLVASYVAVLGGFAATISVWRLTLGKARDPFHNIFLARTPADFWRRYNRSVLQFFYENLFKRVGGMRHPVRGTLIVFAASSVLHEYVFGAAIGAIQGLQTAFFMIQGVGVVLTLRVRPRGGAAVMWTLGTIAFNVATGVLFLASLHQVVPWWDHAPFGLPEPPR